MAFVTMGAPGMATHRHGRFGPWVPDGPHDVVVLPVELSQWLPGVQGHPLQDCLGVRQAVVWVKVPLDGAPVHGGARCQNVIALDSR